MPGNYFWQLNCNYKLVAYKIFAKTFLHSFPSEKERGKWSCRWQVCVNFLLLQKVCCQGGLMQGWGYRYHSGFELIFIHWKFKLKIQQGSGKCSSLAQISWQSWLGNEMYPSCTVLQRGTVKKNYTFILIFRTFLPSNIVWFCVFYFYEILLKFKPWVVISRRFFFFNFRIYIIKSRRHNKYWFSRSQRCEIVVNILLTSSKHQISEFRIPNILFTWLIKQ